MARDALATCGELRQKLDSLGSELMESMAHLDKRVAEMEEKHAAVLEQLSLGETRQTESLVETEKLQRMIDDALSGSTQSQNELQEVLKGSTQVTYVTYDQLQEVLKCSTETHKQELQQVQKAIVQKSSALVQKKQELLAEAVERRLSQEGAAMEAQTKDLDQVRQRQDVLAKELERRLQDSERRSSEVERRASERSTGIPKDIQMALVRVEHCSELRAEAEARTAAVNSELSRLQTSMQGAYKELHRLDALQIPSEEELATMCQEMARKLVLDQGVKSNQKAESMARDALANCGELRKRFVKFENLAAKEDLYSLTGEVRTLQRNHGELAQRLQDGLHLAAEAVAESAESHRGTEEALQHVCSEAKDTYEAQKLLADEMAQFKAQSGGIDSTSGTTKARALRLQAQLRAAAGLLDTSSRQQQA